MLKREERRARAVRDSRAKSEVVGRGGTGEVERSAGAGGRDAEGAGVVGRTEVDGCVLDVEEEAAAGGEVRSAGSPSYASSTASSGSSSFVSIASSRPASTTSLSFLLPRAPETNTGPPPSSKTPLRYSLP